MKVNTSINLLVVLAFAALTVTALSGCSSEPAPAADAPKTESSSATTEPTKTTETSTDEGMVPAAYTNDKGEIVCPVMGTVIADKSKAVGHQDYEGKRYYFCCDMCPDQFKADPAKFADGKALKK